VKNAGSENVIVASCLTKQSLSLIKIEKEEKHSRKGVANKINGNNIEFIIGIVFSGISVNQ